jgi:hypothetical protein
VTPLGGETDSEHRRGIRPSQVESCGEPALCYHQDLSEAARWARACHPAYAGRIHFPVRPGEPSGPIENW